MRQRGNARLLVVGPWSTSGIASWKGGAEILWIKFRLGAFMPHLPIRGFRDVETALPEAASNSFWLNGSAWQYPNYENVETFANRLARGDALVRDPLVDDVLAGRPPELASRTVRHRFLRATGLPQGHIQQFERAQRAAALLQQGASILDTVYNEGYFDQPHLTRSLRQFTGRTPAQILRLSKP
jgi:hypothetical protein